jgi:alginate O-acetyltransferase complex protein AlgI
MLFNSFDYVFFLTAAFALFWALVRLRVLRVILLLVASYLFYMSWNATFIVLIVFSTMVDYAIGLALGRVERPAGRKWLVFASVAVNIGLLGVFKYADFAISAVQLALSSLGLQVELPLLRLVLPVGISFYTFQSLSYTIDIYRRRLEPRRNPLEFAAFVAFFPQLVAGPIVRATQFLPQLDRRPALDDARASRGLFLILLGMTKKVAIADFLAVNLIDRVFDNPAAFSSSEVLAAMYAYTWQLYGDFSGYTDIARGSALLFGFDLPENFRRPFAATGPLDFWRRWHITLSSWVRDYVYIPLGGSERGRGRKYANLFVTLFIIGVWHGAGFTFLLFALWHATGVVINRVWRDVRGEGRGEPAGWRRVLCVVANVHFFVLHWPIFRSPSVERTIEVYEQVLAFQWAPFRVSPAVAAIAVGMFAVHYTPVEWFEKIRDGFARAPAWVQLAVTALVALALMEIGGSQPQPFIYFQF